MLSHSTVGGAELTSADVLGYLRARRPDLQDARSAA